MPAGLPCGRAGDLVLRRTPRRISRTSMPASASPLPAHATHTAMLAFHLGGSVVGLRAHDGRRLIDYLETRRDADTRASAPWASPAGGMHTFFSACLDERIRACVVSGYYSTFRDSILAMHHCPCNFVSGLYAFGEMRDLVGLHRAAPAPDQSGSYDGIFRAPR